MAGASATRRAILGAALTAPLVGTVSVPAVAGTIDRTAWDRAFAAWKHAQGELAAYDATFNPMADACHAETEAVPHVTLDPDPYTGKTEPVSTANWDDVKAARNDTRGRYSIDPKYPDVVAHYALMERLVAAADARDAEVECIRQRYGWHEACERSDALAAAFCDAEGVLMQMPAPDVTALAWKLERLFGDDEPDGYSGSYTVKWTAPLVEDARRLGRA